MMFKIHGTLNEGQVCTVDLLIKVACFVKHEKKISILKAADLKSVLKGGPLY
jgi:hypothetical protein